MENLLSNLQVYQARKIHAGLLDSNNLASLYNTKPFEANAIVTSAIAKTKRNIFDMLTDQIGNVAVMEVDNREVQWKLYLKTDFSYPVSKSVEDFEGSGVTGLGSSGQTFRVGFPERCFTEGDVVIPENDTFRVRVMTEPYNDGVHWVHTFRIFGNYATFPTQEAMVGKRWTRTGTFVSEMSDKGGSPQLSRPIMLRNCLNTLRLQYEISRTAATDGMATVIEAEGADGRKFKYWADLAEWKTMEQFTEDMNYANMYSQYNGSVDLANIIKDKNGRPVYQGAGLQDQVSPGNLFYHNGTLTYGQIKEWFLDLSYQVSYYGGNCELTLIAGWGLMELINRAVLNEFRSVIPTNILTTGASFLDGKGNRLTYTDPEFSTINFANGVTVKLIKFDAFNDRTYFKSTFNGYTRKSYEGIVINTSPSGEGPNLMKVYKKGSENLNWYIPGSYGPNGPTKGASASSIDGYAVHRLSEQGLILKDPTGSARILLNAA